MRPSRRAWLAAALLPLLAVVGCATVPIDPAPAPAAQRAQQKVALRRLGFDETADGWALSLGASVNFPIDEAQLTLNDLANLAHIARVLLSVGIDRILVEGHTDNQGSVEHNRVLSERRADAVASVLVGNGFAPANIARRGLGATRPIADNATEEGRLHNRRAVLIVQSL